MNGIVSTPAEPSTSSDSVSSEPKKKLTKEEKKALYKVTYPEPQNTRRKILKDIYVEEKDDELKNELMASVSYEIFETETNPFTGFLDVYEVLHDCQQGKANSLAGTFLRHFNQWLIKNPDGDIKEAHIDDEIKARAFKVLTKHHAAHVPLGTEVFGFHETEMMDNIRSQITDLVGRLQFKDAMDIAGHFKLQSEYDIFEFCVPCVLQDKLQLVQNYIAGHWNLVRALFKFYDDFISIPQDQIKKNLQEYKDKRIMTMSFDRFCGKGVPEVIKRLFSYFDLDEKKCGSEYAPRYDRHVREKNVKYNVKRRFGDPNAPKSQPLTDESYVSIIKGFMENADMGEKVSFLSYLFSLTQVEDAIRWTIIFEIPNWEIPSSLANYMRHYPGVVAKIKRTIEETAAREDCENLFLEKYPIKIVKTWDEVEEMISHFPNEEVLGIDSEWKPQYTASVDEVALLQIATSSTIYLVDYIALEICLSREQWEVFFDALLLGDSYKLGFDFINDLHALFNNPCTKEFKKVKDYEIAAKNALCIKLLMENVLEVDESFVDLSKPVKADSDTSLEGAGYEVHFKLSDLCEKMIGEVLDKMEQCSDWALRPLTESQVLYAAKDAFVLPRLFNKIKDIAKERDVDLEQLIPISFATIPKKEKIKVKKLKTQKVDDMTWKELVEKMNTNVLGENVEPKKATEFRCLVDQMLRGLGKHLRRIGADVVLPETKEELLRVARNDRERLIISSGKAYEQLRTNFPSRVMCVQNNSPLQQLKYVVDRNNLVLSKEDVFSRCMECNEAAFLVAPGPVLEALHDCNVTCTGIYHEETFDVEKWKMQLSSVDPDKYDGYGCKLLQTPEVDPNWLTVLVHRGMIDITRNLVIHEARDDHVFSQIHKIDSNLVISREGRFFYVCCGCGKIYWDGAHQENYVQRISDVIPDANGSPTATSSSSSEITKTENES